MSNQHQKPVILVTGATGQVRGTIVRLLAARTDLEMVLAVRSPEEAAHFGLPVVEMDFDRPKTRLPAFEGVDGAFLMTGYTIDMLRQSKSLIDDAKKAGVKHIVHLGARDPDDTRPAEFCPRGRAKLCGARSIRRAIFWMRSSRFGLEEEDGAVCRRLFRKPRISRVQRTPTTHCVRTSC
ncbi:NAD(P)H-binding protein [Bosea sp. 2KB_26]|uniref:NmrA family NAD(P)-binding protein n=1 Tax=Bosea sp. 2KB_26 TaxID=3237475 RepID=UPI003F8F8FF5